MTTMALAAQDSATMLRRNLKHMLRYPSMTVMLVGQPIVFMLLFVYVFGGTMGAGIAGSSAGRSEYLAYITPGILAMAVASVALGTAISVAMDMTEGIIARFRTMAIARVSILTGHVVGAMIQTAIALVVVIAVAFLLGFRSEAGATAWLSAGLLLMLFAFALTWLTVALGLVSKSVETASNLPMFLVLLPFLGSGFVPTDTMPVGVRWFADYQPFTPVIETLRGLVLGVPIDGYAPVLALGWCVVIAVGSYLWARRLYNREPAH
jgi:ABC-2 type transport system permease protein